MSLTEVLSELPKFSADELCKIQARIDELGPRADSADEELTSEELAVIESRLDECEKNPGSFIPWKTVKAELKARYGN